jgi:hypothetical protein
VELVEGEDDEEYEDDGEDDEEDDDDDEVVVVVESNPDAVSDFLRFITLLFCFSLFFLVN